MTQQGEELYYGGRDRYLHRISLNSLQTLDKLEPPHFSQITALARLQDCIVSASADKNLRMWEGHKELCTVCGAHSGSVLALAAAEELLFSAGRGEQVKVWKAQPGLGCVSGFVVPENVLSLAATSDSGVIVGTEGGKLQLWHSQIS